MSIQYQAIIDRAIALLPKVRQWRINENWTCSYLIVSPNEKFFYKAGDLESPQIYSPGCLAFSHHETPEVFYAEGSNPRLGATHWQKIEMP